MAHVLHSCKDTPPPPAAPSGVHAAPVMLKMTLDGGVPRGSSGLGESAVRFRQVDSTPVAPAGAARRRGGLNLKSM